MQTLLGDSPNYPVPKPLNYFEGVYKFQWGKEDHAPPPGNYDPSVILPRAADSSIKWVTVQIPTDPVPQDAVLAGNDVDGRNIYVARVRIDTPEGTVIYPGKYEQTIFHTAYQGVERFFKEGPVDVLVGNSNSMTWVSTQGPFELNSLHGFTPLPVGEDLQNKPMYSARASAGPNTGTMHPGWVSVDGTAHISYGGAEFVEQVYDVLVYAH
ncbi:hypothetical protein DL96DRAFT_874242 [Flagelloscypha sp. PMI_526]|nr:hypothetical protein DL96DRAFT_874242 [Flagelloscypha sp. PMI_526]